MQQLCVLGATGSIGDSTFKVIRGSSGNYQVTAISAFSQIDKCANLCAEFGVLYAWVSQDQAQKLKTLLKRLGADTQVLSDIQDLERLASLECVDTVMAAIVGSAGLPPTLAAVKAGKKVLLANKEALVMAGDLMLSAAKSSGAQILPVDSEHNAIFQCLPSDPQSLRGFHTRGVEHVTLTASGGPFIGMSTHQLGRVTVEQACAHPNWSMGAKISVDSATLMNKGLELIEASLLFDMAPARIKVVVHPQSIVHSAVHYSDGSVLAQMGAPDMQTPIAHALSWPERQNTQVKPLNFIEIARLDFLEPDTKTFRALALAYQAAEQGGSAPLILNAANEAAVQAFLESKISFLQIAEVVERVLDLSTPSTPIELGAIYQEHDQAYALAGQQIHRLSRQVS